MDSVKKYKELPTLWVKVWIGIGIAAIIFSVMTLLVLGVLLNSEKLRMDGCQAGTRSDCDVSLIWALQGYEGPQVQAPAAEDQTALKAESDQKLAIEYDHGIRYYQTNNQTPQVSGVDMRGADYNTDWYSAPAGTEIEIVIKPEGDFDHAALYVHPKVSPTPGVGIYEGDFTEQGDGTYLVVYRVPKDLEADLEARVVNSAGDSGSAFIQFHSK